MENLEKRMLKELKYGSKKAFEYVFNTYYSCLCRYAEEILKDAHQAEDVVVHLFVILWEDKKKINIHTSFRSYLYRSTYNACMNVIRKKKSENKYREFFLNHSDLSKTHDYGSSSYPLSGIIEKEMDEEINEVIGRLPQQCKKVFLLSRIDAYSHQEIADKLGISINTVKCHIMCALKRIKITLNGMMNILLLFSAFNYMT